MKVFNFTRDNKCIGFACLTCTTCTTYTVRIAFRILWQIIVIYMRYAGNIKATSSHISSYKNVNCTFSELTNYTITFLL